MSDYEMLTTLLDLPNVQVTHYQLVGADRLNVFVQSTAAVAVCPQCQQSSTTVHDVGEPQMLRDLPIWNRRCWLRYAPRRFHCATCHTTFVERVAWRESGGDYTLRYEQYLYQRAHHEPIAQIAQDEQVSKDSVRSVFERWAKKAGRAGLSAGESAVLG